MEYHLIINDAQAQTIIKALDTLMRIKIGQFNIVAEILVTSTMQRNVPDENMDKGRRFLDLAQMQLFPEFNSPSASYGIREAPENLEKVAYDLLQVIRHRLSWDNLKPGDKPNGVWYDKPWFCSEQPPPEIINTQTKERIANCVFALETNLNNVQNRISKQETLDILAEMSASLEKLKNLIKAEKAA